MKSFERLVEDKNRVIKDCDNFIKELKDISLQTSGISTLIKLLSEKKEKYLELKYDNYKESTLSIENLDEKIYRQIVLLEKQNSQEAKSTLEKFGYEYRDQQKIKFIFKKIYFAKKHYKGLIALLGLMPFIIYFVLNRNIGYIPMPESGDIFSILVSLALAGLSLLFILYLMPILQLAVVFYMRDIKGILPVFLLSILLSVALIVLILNDISWISKNLELSFVSFYIIDILLIYIGLLFKTKSQKLMIFKSEQFWLLAFHGFISILSPFVIFLLVYSRVSNDSIENIVIVSIFILLAITLLFFLLLEKDLYYFAFWFYAFTVINLILVCLISDRVIQISDLGNIKYKYLTVEKSIREALPIEICNKDCNTSKTYYNEKEAKSVIKIYNIKVLSTPGKFYYLEADGNATDKKVKFKLDASKITPGPILER
jgi:membrane protein